METIELKNTIIQEINSINDVPFLETIQSLIEAKADKKLIRLTQKHKDEIKLSQQEVVQGLFIDHNDLDKEVNEWLNAK